MSRMGLVLVTVIGVSYSQSCIAAAPYVTRGCGVSRVGNLVTLAVRRKGNQRKLLNLRLTDVNARSLGKKINSQGLEGFPVGFLFGSERGKCRPPAPATRCIT